jgi:hypothetical protein
VASWLQPAALEAVDVKGMVLVLVGVAGFAFTAGSLFGQETVNPSLSRPLVVAISRGAAPEQGLDAYGNEVTNAVAEYSLDPAGDLYELHSPQIELPRLGSPKS